MFDDPAALRAKDVDNRIATIASMELLEHVKDDEIAVGEDLANSAVRRRIVGAEEADELAKPCLPSSDAGLCWM